MSSSALICFSVVAFALYVSAHDTTQQPLVSTNRHSWASIDDDFIDITSGSQFSGLTTYGNLPYVNCFLDVEAEKSPYDIAILGAPFDTVSNMLTSLNCPSCMQINPAYISSI